MKFKVVEQGFDRVLGESALVADALKQWITPEQLLAAASLSLGALEGIVVPAMIDQNEDLTKKAASECMISLLESEGLISRPDGKKRFLKAVKDKKSKAE